MEPRINSKKPALMALWRAASDVRRVFVSDRRFRSGTDAWNIYNGTPIGEALVAESNGQVEEDLPVE